MTQGTELARDFLSSVGGFLAPTTEGPGAKSSDRPFRLGTVDAAFSATTGGMPRIKFDGESTLSGRGYPWAGDRVPVAGERTILAPVGSGYVILGPPRLDRAQVPAPVSGTKYFSGIQGTPPAGATIVEMKGYGDLTKDSAGIALFTYPEAFPNAIGGISVLTLQYAAVQPVINSGKISKSQAELIWVGAGSGRVTFSWSAWGW